MRQISIALLVATAVAAVPLGAQTVYNARVAAAMHTRGRYQELLCPLKGKDFRTNSASVYLKSAVEGITDDNGGGHSEVDAKKYTDIVKKAVSTATDAVTNSPQSAAGWYYLGRADLQLGDLRGADTAFDKVQQLSPDCTEELKGLRQKAWVALVSPSPEFMRKSQDTTLSAAQQRAWSDSALDVLRDANLIADFYPQGMYNMAGTFANRQQYDSAIVYFKLALAKAGTDSQFAGMHKQGTQDLALLYSQTKDYPDAIQEWRAYLAIDPTDTDAKRSLAQLLELTGNKADAAQVENQLMASGAMNPGELINVGVRAFRDSNYAAAADAFQKVLAIEPNNHDALYDLANSYYLLKDGAKLEETSQKLLNIEPLSQNNYKLLINAYRLQGNQDKQITATTSLLGLATTLKVDSFRMSTSGARLYGTATGMEALTAAGKTILPAALTVTLEFLNAQGAVITAQDVAIPALPPNVTSAFTAEVTGAGIVAWRYHQKT